MIGQLLFALKDDLTEETIAGLLQYAAAIEVTDRRIIESISEIFPGFKELSEFVMSLLDYEEENETE